jgi:hypothetical protein
MLHATTVFEGKSGVSERRACQLGVNVSCLHKNVDQRRKGSIENSHV